MSFPRVVYRDDGAGLLYPWQTMGVNDPSAWRRFALHTDGITLSWYRNHARMNGNKVIRHRPGTYSQFHVSAPEIERLRTETGR